MNKNRNTIQSITKESFLKDFAEDGYVVVENVFSAQLINEIIPELHKAIEQETKQYHLEEHNDYGMLRACPIYGGKFFDVLENKDYFRPFNWILGDTCIIWVYTTSCLPPKSGNYASRIHVDRPHFIPNFNEGVGSLILLDDFTEENGATWFLPQSHLKADEPDRDHFFKNAIRLVAPKGSVIYFNLRLWHAGGINTTDKWRNGLGIGMIRPYYKQRIDLPRIMKSVDVSGLSDFAKQKLGFYAQPPESLDEYYHNEKNKSKIQPSEWEKNK